MSTAGISLVATAAAFSVYALRRVGLVQEAWGVLEWVLDAIDPLATRWYILDFSEGLHRKRLFVKQALGRYSLVCVARRHSNMLREESLHDTTTDPPEQVKNAFHKVVRV